MSEITDELVARASAGDMAAFEEIYAATSRFVYNVALRVTGNSRDAEEVTQDVFVKAYNNLRGFGFRSAFRTWLYRIAANTAINHAKRAARHRRSSVEYDPAIHDAAVSSSPDLPAESAEWADMAKDMLARLDPDQRVCITLREIEGMDYRQIADTLGIKINTVRSRLKRGREKLIAMARRRGW